MKNLVQINFEVTSNEVESKLNKFFNRFKKVKVNFTPKEVYFSIGTIWSLIFDLNPDNEIVEGTIKLKPMGEERTLLDISFSRTKVLLFTFGQNIIALILSWFLLQWLSSIRNIEDPNYVFLILIFLIVLVTLAQLLITFSSERRVVNALKKLTDEEWFPIVTSTKFRIVYYSLLGFFFISGIYLGALIFW